MKVTRLTNVHRNSQKHYKATPAIFLEFYNFTPKNEAVKGNTPAIASRLADKV